MSEVPQQSVFSFQVLFAHFTRVRSLSIVLQNIKVILSHQQLTSRQKTELENIAQGCRNVLEELEETLDSYEELASSAKSLGGKLRRLLERLKWDEKDIDEFRSRIASNGILFNTFLEQINR
jgi:peptidoglycan hydrolase CwlO-like protein